MKRSLSWLRRKCEQLAYERYSKHVQSVNGQVQGLLIIIDKLFGDGQNTNTILPPTLEEAIEQSELHQLEHVEVQKQQNQYDKTQWWLKPKGESESP
ncbi:hypothetical protein P4V72_05620 [Bacillus thuringiensis]|uniref:Uncharacterized protein n=3 Tax=root TaxID=1 RepID=A0A9W3XMB1_BACTU|nr:MULTISPECIES: hypothetical protein [Bacillus cereus group]YP_009845455.1 putative tail assembly chaperone [Bacillus phage vB_BtS_B83]MEB9095216.1 hypothetical protein [Bacillus cereus]AQY42384.1 hypothetical protein B4918_31265 [Bacillus thuringiensis]EJP81287.1 hypothetical protein IC1_06533 [Bacillus cereus VD022]EOQ56194.1 hypothetical protein IAY_06541 [Bacillus cereus TIAC219]MDR4148498.1 hypothetical protein [Bacillus thuringiensis]